MLVGTPSAAVSEDSRVGQKRRAEDLPKAEEAADGGPALDGSKPKPRPPLAKRQRQGPSLFIPKKVCYHVVTVEYSNHRSY